MFTFACLTWRMFIEVYTLPCRSAVAAHLIALSCGATQTYNESKGSKTEKQTFSLLLSSGSARLYCHSSTSGAMGASSNAATHSDEATETWLNTEFDVRN